MPVEHIRRESRARISRQEHTMYTFRELRRRRWTWKPFDTAQKIDTCPTDGEAKRKRERDRACGPMVAFRWPGNLKLAASRLWELRASGLMLYCLQSWARRIQRSLVMWVRTLGVSWSSFSDLEQITLAWGYMLDSPRCSYNSLRLGYED